MSPDPYSSDPSLPDTAMATGNDEGEPGESSHPPLGAGEQEVLAALGQPDDRPAEPAVEDRPEVAAAAADDAPLPADGSGGGNDDGLDARFTDR
ncbi:hypothetical protein [Modestobacter sp. SYSU DS0290]